MDLSPRHRTPWTPGVDPSSAIPGGLRLHDGRTGEDLLGLPGGPVLESRWTGSAWESRVDGRLLSGSPWEALEAIQPQEAGPWVGAATFELACDEASLPRQPLVEGTLGQRWTALRRALYAGPAGTEAWSWEDKPPEVLNYPLFLDHPFPARADLLLLPQWTQHAHREAVKVVQARIRDGGFYVANLCVPFEGKWEGPVSTLARTAFNRARPPFGALLDLGDLTLLCLSMERLLARRRNRVWSEPIKGSAPFTGKAETDRQAAVALAADPKERAEHTMILDLVRNDLGRVARTGTVAVTRALAVETYPTVQHLVSTVEAEARPGLGLAELLRAVLPGGSVTGAPKHAVCAHLARAEAGPRGFYCGALGWIGPNGDLDLALPIRTAQIAGDRLRYWAGGGITRRSDPEREWAELLLKTRALTG
ncbi:anthranilate synthase component I family protein [Geothrix sp. 21YS21S-4]|uniref:chorismate-binding protein n=1 Tax=Geothrix sp. 21YS21S-4 TaxID=3068889 RepID=UPI0027B9CA61|nr:anthranilate synthase component I family protein [Geothrix sp. 21YS21S-4]